MSSDDLLDGKAGPEAQANEILRLVNAAAEQAYKEIALVAGNDATVALASYPMITIGTKGGGA